MLLINVVVYGLKHNGHSKTNQNSDGSEDTVRLYRHDWANETAQEGDSRCQRGHHHLSSGFSQDVGVTSYCVVLKYWDASCLLPAFMENKNVVTPNTDDYDYYRQMDARKVRDHENFLVD